MIKSLGQIVVAAAGTPVRVRTAVPFLVKGIQFQALPGNAGLVYIGTVGMVRATGVGVLAVLPKPVSATTGPFTAQSFGDPTNPAHLSAGDFYVDADNANDGVAVSVVSETQ